MNEDQAPATPAPVSPEQLLRDAQNLLKKACTEIQMLRGQTTEMMPKVKAYELLSQVLGMYPRPQIFGGYPDVLRDIEQHLGMGDNPELNPYTVPYAVLQSGSQRTVGPIPTGPKR